MLEILLADRPPTIDINEVDPNGQAAVKRRLPPELQQKLAEVARSSANQGKIQEHELMNRLMCIVGHLVQHRTLKVSACKMEINEMIIALMAKVNEQQDGSADDFQVANDEL